MVDKFGERVSYFRKSKGLSIKKLAENICDESTIYRLEKGKQLPRIEILNDICLKLEIPFKALFPLNEEVAKLKKMCREFTYTEDYLSLELKLEECNNLLEEINSPYSAEEFRRFILWHRAILLHKKENKIADAFDILNNLVNLENCVSELDIAILNSMGLTYLSNKDFDAALNLYKLIFSKIKDQKIVEDFTLLARVGYNYANTLFKLKKYENALEIAQEVLYYVETHHLIYMLGELHHIIGTLSKKNGDLLNAEESFKNAILVFKITKDKVNLARAEIDLSNLQYQ